jgi:hypothetical protein
MSAFTETSVLTLHRSAFATEDVRIIYVPFGGLWVQKTPTNLKSLIIHAASLIDRKCKVRLLSTMIKLFCATENRLRLPVAERGDPWFAENSGIHSEDARQTSSFECGLIIWTDAKGKDVLGAMEITDESINRIAIEDEKKGNGRKFLSAFAKFWSHSVPHLTIYARADKNNGIQDFFTKCGWSKCRDLITKPEFKWLKDMKCWAGKPSDSCASMIMTDDISISRWKITAANRLRRKTEVKQQIKVCLALHWQTVCSAFHLLAEDDNELLFDFATSNKMLGFINDRLETIRLSVLGRNIEVSSCVAFFGAYDHIIGVIRPVPESASGLRDADEVVDAIRRREIMGLRSGMRMTDLVWQIEDEDEGVAGNPQEAHQEMFARMMSGLMREVLPVLGATTVPKNSPEGDVITRLLSGLRERGVEATFTPSDPTNPSDMD